MNKLIAGIVAFAFTFLLTICLSLFIENRELKVSYLKLVTDADLLAQEVKALKEKPDSQVNCSAWWFGGLDDRALVIKRRICGR